MLQVCTQEKSEIEFVKSGLDMVVKKSADDHAKKIKEMEKRSEQAFDSKSIYSIQLDHLCTRAKSVQCILFFIFATSV